MPSDGVGLLSWQLATDRIFDGFEKRREQRAAQQNAQNVYQYLQSQIDDLRADWQEHAEKLGSYVDQWFAAIEQRVTALEQRSTAPQVTTPQNQSLEKQLAALKAKYEQLEKENDLHKLTIAEVERLSSGYYEKAKQLRMTLINTQDELKKFTGERRPDPPEI